MDGLQGRVIFLDAIELNLFSTESLLNVLEFELELLSIVEENISFLVEFLDGNLSIFELISDLLNFTRSLGVEVGIISLQGVHFPLESSLFLPLDHAFFLVFDQASSHLGLKLLLLLV